MIDKIKSDKMIVCNTISNFIFLFVQLPNYLFLTLVNHLSISDLSNKFHIMLLSHLGNSVLDVKITMDCIDDN